MRPKPKTAPRPTYDDLVRVLGELVAMCRNRRVNGAALNHAEHIHNRALLAKGPNRSNMAGSQGRLI